MERIMVGINDMKAKSAKDACPAKDDRGETFEEFRAKALEDVKNGQLKKGTNLRAAFCNNGPGGA
jgi:hypothetical protein